MAEPFYTVTVSFEIGIYRGEWTGREEKMRKKYVILCESPSKEYAELLYKRIVAEAHSLRANSLPSEADKP